SLLGAVYVLGALALVFQGVPWLWKTGVAPWIGESLPFVNTAGLITVMVFAAVALFVFGLTLVGPAPSVGLRAGIFTVIVGGAAGRRCSASWSCWAAASTSWCSTARSPPSRPIGRCGSRSRTPASRSCRTWRSRPRCYWLRRPFGFPSAW